MRMGFSILATLCSGLKKLKVCPVTSVKKVSILNIFCGRVQDTDKKSEGFAKLFFSTVVNKS